MQSSTKQVIMAFYNGLPTNNMVRSNNKTHSTPIEPLEEENSLNEESESHEVSRTKILTVVGMLFVTALIVAAIIIPLYLVPLLTATTTKLKTTTTTTTTKTTSTTSTTTTTTSSTSSTTSTSVTTTTAVTLYIPSNYYTPCTATCTNVTTSTPSTLLASWDFENNLVDSTGSYNGYMNSSAAYIVGYINQAMAVNSANYMIVSTYLNLYNRPFTIEAWIYLTSLTSSVDYGIVGQCPTIATRQCLHCIIRSNKLYLGLYGDDIGGATTLSTGVWTHVAFVYDSTSNLKSVYLNGILDGVINTGGSYQGSSGVTYVGYATDSASITPLPGYIDQVTISNRAKSACEILNDATLVSRYTFDNTTADSGPNGLTSYRTVQGSSGVSYITGRLNQALQLSTTNAFFQGSGYYALGVANQPFSFALWINPIVIGGTLIHVSSDRSGSGGWCLPFLGFSINGSIVAQSWLGPVVSVIGPQIPTNNWTHVVETWSSTNGLRLYINGALYGSSAMSTFSSNSPPLYIFLGTSGFGISCHTTDIVMDTYSGGLDEFYVYSRELTASEICSLAHP